MRIIGLWENQDMVTSNIKAVFRCDISKVWDVVTSLENYRWRSDLSKVEVVSERKFIEYTKDGYPTIFTITCMEPYRRWEFDMENGNMYGRWTGVFIEKGDRTEIDFTEEVTVKKITMKPFIKRYLKKQQGSYVADLRKALGGI